MNYNKCHRPNLSLAQQKGKSFFFFFFFLNVLQDYSQYDNTCILLHLKYFFWPIITKNVLLPNYYTTGPLLQNDIHIATFPPAPSSGYFKDNCLIFKKVFQALVGVHTPFFDADV